MLPRPAGCLRRGRLHSPGGPGRLTQRSGRGGDRAGRHPPAGMGQDNASGHPSHQDDLPCSPTALMAPRLETVLRADVNQRRPVAYLDQTLPLAFAHRGGAAHRPENSWAALSTPCRSATPIWKPTPGPPRTASCWPSISTQVHHDLFAAMQQRAIPPQLPLHGRGNIDRR